MILNIKTIKEKIMSLLPMATSMAVNDDFTYRTLALSPLLVYANAHDPNQWDANSKLVAISQLLVALLSPSFCINVHGPRLVAELKELKIGTKQYEQKEAEIFDLYVYTLFISLHNLIPASIITIWADPILRLAGENVAASALTQDFTRTFYCTMGVPALFVQIATLQLIYIFEQKKALNFATINWVSHILLAAAISIPESGFPQLGIKGVASIYTSQIICSTLIYWFALKNNPHAEKLCDIRRITRSMYERGYRDLASASCEFIKKGGPIISSVYAEIGLGFLMTILVGQLSQIERDAFNCLFFPVTINLPILIHLALAGMIQVGFLTGQQGTTAHVIQEMSIASVSATILVGLVLPAFFAQVPTANFKLLQISSAQVQQKVSQLQSRFSLASWVDGFSFSAMYLLRCLPHKSLRMSLSWQSTLARVGSLLGAMCAMMVSHSNLDSISLYYLLGMMSSAISLIGILCYTLKYNLHLGAESVPNELLTEAPRSNETEASLPNTPSHKIAQSLQQFGIYNNTLKMPPIEPQPSFVALQIA